MGVRLVAQFEPLQDVLGIRTIGSRIADDGWQAFEMVAARKMIPAVPECVNTR